MTANLKREEIVLKAERFGDLNKCKREPVTKLPIDFDALPKLKWREDNTEIQESVQMLVVNSFFTTIDIKFSDGYSDLYKEYDRIKSDLSKNLRFQSIINTSSLFNQKSFEKFIEAMAKMVVKLAKDKNMDTKYVKRALPVFGFLGTDDCFCSFYNGKIEQQRRWSYYDTFNLSLHMKGSPYTKLLESISGLDNSPYDSISLLQEISGIRKIFTDESTLKDDNTLTRKKLKTAQLTTRTWKSTEKILSGLYADFLQDSLAVYRKMNRDDLYNLFVDDVCGLRFGRVTVWGLYENNTLDQTFTIGEQRKFYDVSGNVIELENFPGKTIDLVHPVELSADDVTAWKNYFDRMELTPLFEQLDIPVFRKDGRALDTYLNNADILPESFWKRKQMGFWEKVEEEGIIFFFCRAIAMRNSFYCATIKTYIDLRSWDNEPVFEYIKFYFHGDEKFQSYRIWDDEALDMNDVPERFYSEVCRDIEKYFLRKKL